MERFLCNLPLDFFEHFKSQVSAHGQPKVTELKGYCNPKTIYNAL